MTFPPFIILLLPLYLPISIYLFINCLFTGVLDPSVVGVVKRFTIKTLFAKHVIKCTTFDVSLVLCVANNYQPERSCISNLETRDSSAKITTSNKVSWNYKLFIVLSLWLIAFSKNAVIFTSFEYLKKRKKIVK